MSSTASVFVISSQVTSGQVGLNAILPALRALDFEAVSLPSLVLAAHPAAFPAAGPPPRLAVTTTTMRAQADWLLAAGALDNCRAVLTGYLPTPAHVEAAASIVKRVKDARPDAVYCCDPVCGDNGRLYLPETVLDALRDRLLPLADLATPNLYELGRLAGTACETDAETVAAARHLKLDHVVVTSSPAPTGRVAALAVTPRAVKRCETQAVREPPHGVGDCFAALYLGLTLQGDPMALGKSCATLAQMTAQNPDTGQLPVGPTGIAPPALTDRLPL